MRLILFLIISISALTASGQIESLNEKSVLDSTINDQTKYDCIPFVVYEKENEIGRQPAFFINGQHFDASIIKTIDPKLIDSINVVKEEIEIQGEKFYGRIYLKMKKGYSPKLISLIDLKLKYTTLSDAPTIFIIDNEIVKDDYSKFIVDEKYILKIIVDRIDKEEEDLHVDIVHLLTKTEENIKKSKRIILRGTDETTLN